MEYVDVKDIARKWRVSDRLVQKYCAKGRIENAVKSNGQWKIPSDARKPQDPRRQQGRSFRRPAIAEHARSGLMPLTNATFEPGRCLCLINSMKDSPRKDIALAEYRYYSGDPEDAAKSAELYLANKDAEIRLSACLVYLFSSLAIGRVRRVRHAFSQITSFQAQKSTEGGARAEATQALLSATAAVLLRRPLPHDLPPAHEFLPVLPPGLRTFAFYVRARYAYLQKDYRKSLGIVETALSAQEKTYPIPTIYLHMAATMSHLALKQPEQAREHLLAAWEMARPDGLIEGLGECHGMLGAVPETVIRKDWPGEFEKIAAIARRFSTAWRKVHAPDSELDIANNLTAMEFPIAMLAARGWTNREIGCHMGISVNTVKGHMSSIMQKLGVESRRELEKHMLV